MSRINTVLWTHIGTQGPDNLCSSRKLRTVHDKDFETARLRILMRGPSHLTLS